MGSLDWWMNGIMDGLAGGRVGSCVYELVGLWGFRVISAHNKIGPCQFRPMTISAHSNFGP